jgi:predicted Na+-dependent transporter
VFALVGFLLVWARRPPIHPLPATMLGAGLAVLLAAGKFLFHGRHMAVADIVVETTGALLGALLAWQWARRHAPDQQEGARPPVD